MVKTLSLILKAGLITLCFTLVNAAGAQPKSDPSASIDLSKNPTLKLKLKNFSLPPHADNMNYLWIGSNDFNMIVDFECAKPETAALNQKPEYKKQLGTFFMSKNDKDLWVSHAINQEFEVPATDLKYCHDQGLTDIRLTIGDKSKLMGSNVGHIDLSNKINNTHPIIQHHLLDYDFGVCSKSLVPRSAWEITQQ